MCVIDAPVLARGKEMVIEEMPVRATYMVYSIYDNDAWYSSGEVEKQGLVVINSKRLVPSHIRALSDKTNLKMKIRNGKDKKRQGSCFFVLCKRNRHIHPYYRPLVAVRRRRCRCLPGLSL